MRLAGEIELNHGVHPSDGSAAKVHLDPVAFCQLLEAHGIRYETQQVSGSDGKNWVQIWVHDEDEIASAQALFKAFKEHPEKYPRASPPLLAKKEPEQLASHGRPKRHPLLPSAAPLSILLLFAVVVLFIWAHRDHESYEAPKIPTVAEAPIFSPTEKKLLYDYPHYFVLRDELLTYYSTVSKKGEINSTLKKKPQEGANEVPNSEALALMEKMKGVSYWNGIYYRVVDHLKRRSVPLKYVGPMFEKIKEGQIWRLFTPVLLHYDWLHIVLNVMWFVILAGQIEFRLGSLRFLFFLVATAVVSNTAQYLMAGSFFLGLSGIVCAMAGFIWARQSIAPWEGYLLNRLTVIFLMIFVFGIFGLQIVVFFLELFSKVKLEIPIANTAHIVGGVIGYLLGRLKLFSLRTRR